MFKPLESLSEAICYVGSLWKFWNFGGPILSQIVAFRGENGWKVVGHNSFQVLIQFYLFDCFCKNMSKLRNDFSIFWITWKTTFSSLNFFKFSSYPKPWISFQGSEKMGKYFFFCAKTIKRTDSSPHAMQSKAWYLNGEG